VSRAHVE